MKHGIEGINPSAEPSGTGCVECMEEGSWWFHLRRCAECGHIGCCDSSPNQHASKQLSLERTLDRDRFKSALCHNRTVGQYGDRRSSLDTSSLGRLSSKFQPRQAGGEEWYGNLHVAAFSRSRAVLR